MARRMPISDSDATWTVLFHRLCWSGLLGLADNFFDFSGRGVWRAASGVPVIGFFRVSICAEREAWLK